MERFRRRRGRAAPGCAWAMLAATVLAPAMSAGEKPGRLTLDLRGVPQRLYYIPAQAPRGRVVSPILFIPGDGGWHGAAIDMGRMMASLGYEVYGLDVRRYLEGFTKGPAILSPAQMAADIEWLAGSLLPSGGQGVILTGWSQGAAMAVLAEALAKDKQKIRGVLTIALPRSGALAWRWRDSLFALVGRDAREPSFETGPLLPEVAPAPLWMVYGTRDRFTPAAAARRLVSLARRPRRRREIDGGDHGLTGRRKELLDSLRAGLAWIESQDALRRRRPADNSGTAPSGAVRGPFREPLSEPPTPAAAVN